MGRREHVRMSYGKNQGWAVLVVHREEACVCVVG